jgi:hypothetical protein
MTSVDLLLYVVLAIILGPVLYAAILRIASWWKPGRYPTPDGPDAYATSFGDVPNVPGRE